MTDTDAAMFSSLAMYPFDHLRPVWDRWYAAVAARVPNAPPTLCWDVDAHDTWRSSQLALGMSCGWPLVTLLREGVRVLGALAFELDGAVDHYYRSVIIAREGTTLPLLLEAPSPLTLAVNGTDSLSGYVSVLPVFAGHAWEHTITGTHPLSVDAVRDGRADAAAIDAVTWAYLSRDMPAVVEGLTVIGHGPAIPTLPLITNGSASDETVAAWRDGLAQAVRDPQLRAEHETLLIRGFAPLDLSDYEAELADLRARFEVV